MASPLNPNNPIPNGPFFYPETWYIHGALGPLITGSGLCINTVTGTICATGGGGGGGGVTSITAGAGLTGGTITSTGTIALETTGVGPGLYPRASVTVDQYGRITNISSNPVPGTVCSITTGTGLTGGTITDNGTIAITPTGVSAGTYTYPSITVNTEGQIVSASSCTAVCGVCAGPGLCVVGGGGPITSSGTLALTNTGATPGNYTLTNLTVDAQGRISIAASGSAVTCVASGTGLTGGPITGTGTLCLSNTGVTSGCYRAANICVDPQGRITFAECGCVVTCITTGVGLTGGPITSTGSVALAPVSPSSAGTYCFANITVDTYGRVTAASPSNLALAITGNLPITVTGSPTSVAISVQDASISQKGVVSLIDNVTTNCTTAALTAAQGFALQQQINALTVSGGLRLAGTFDATASQMLTVTNDGASAGFAIGSNLPAPAVGNSNYFVIVTTSGTYSPPGGGGPFNLSQGDWLLSNGTLWQFLNVGGDTSYATTLNPGVIKLATSAEVKTGADSTLAVTPLTLFNNYVAKTSYASKGDILVASAAETYSALPVSSTNGSPLIACPTSPLGVAYGPLPINQNLLLAKGDIIVASGAAAPAQLAVGLDGYILSACSTETLGVKWIPNSTNFISCAQITGVGSLITGSAPGVPSTLGSSNNNGDVLVVCTACTNGLAWCTLPASIPTSCITNKGVILTGSSANTPTALGAGPNGFVLAACNLCATGLYWSPPASGAATPTVAGVVLGCTTGNNSFLGCNAGCGVTTGGFNTLLGVHAGCNITTGFTNVAIGSYTTVNSGTASCQLAIGFGPGANWLTGDSNRHIRPGAGIRDCTNNLGAAGQFLASTGTAIQWAAPGPPAFISAGTVQDVGLAATGGASPWPGNTVNNNISYRGTGVNQWEVVGTLYQDGFSPGASNGNGDYLFTLPNGLRFNFFLPFQWTWTGPFNRGYVLGYALPGSWVLGGFETDGWYGQNAIVPFDATRYRVVASTAGGSNFWGSGFYALAQSPPLYAKWSFTFFAQ